MYPFLALALLPFGTGSDAGSDSCDSGSGIAFLQQSVALRLQKTLSLEEQQHRSLLNLLTGPMLELSTLDMNGRRCLGCEKVTEGYVQRSDCGEQNVFDHPENMHKPLRSFSRAAGPGRNASNAYCELNYGKTCADAQFNRDYLMLTKALKVNKSTAAYDHQMCLQNGWLSSEIRAVQHDFQKMSAKAEEFCTTPQRVKEADTLTLAQYLSRYLRSRPWANGAPTNVSMQWLGSWACAMGTAACDMAHCAYTFCSKENGDFGVREECDGWDPVKGMPF